MSRRDTDDVSCSEKKKGKNAVFESILRRKRNENEQNHNGNFNRKMDSQLSGGFSQNLINSR
jgi:hypothetical protein